MNVSPNAPALRIVDQLDADVAAHVRSVMSTALSPEEQDDRFDAWPSAPDEWETATTPSGFLAVLATCDDRPIGYLGGTRDDGERRQLDALIDGDGASACGGAQAVLAAMLGAVVDHLTDDSTDSTTTTDGDSDVVEIWGRPARAWHETVASHHGMTPLRSLHQMRCRLPVEAAPLPTRPYAASDLADLREVNNRAFASHPDQGSQTVESLTASMAESWFRPEGVRIYEQGRPDGRLLLDQDPPVATRSCRAG